MVRRILSGERMNGGEEKMLEVENEGEGFSGWLINNTL
jgi:hypothetical protein